LLENSPGNLSYRKKRGPTKRRGRKN
jgi:hypothetical protein